MWRKNIVSSLSQMVGAFILISAVDNLFDAKRKITSSTVNEFSLIILRRSNLGVCNSSIFLGRVSSMSLGLMHALKKACCYVVLDVRSIELYSRTALYNRASTRAGEPVAPPSLSGLIIRVNVMLLLLLLLLHLGGLALRLRPVGPLARAAGRVPRALQSRDGRSSCRPSSRCGRASG